MTLAPFYRQENRLHDIVEIANGFGQIDLNSASSVHSVV